MSKFPPVSPTAAGSAGDLEYHDYFFDLDKWNAASQEARNAACDAAGEPRVPPPLTARQQAVQARRYARWAAAVLARPPGA